MKKKIGIILLIIAILIILITGVIIFTGIGGEIRAYLKYKILTPKETIDLGKIENIKVTYTYRWQEESFDINVTDKDLIEMIENSISNKKLENYSSQIGLAIMGEYTIDIGNKTGFKFDSYDEDGFVIMYNNDKSFLTKINPEILRKIVDLVDEKLTEKVQMYKTDKISITKSTKGENGTILKEDIVNIEEKTAIEYIINQCKNIYTKEINYQPSIVSPNYEIDFNNNIKLLIYSKEERGWMLKDGFLLEAYGLNVFDTILENSFDNIANKKEMFTADKITITSPKKEIEITNKETIEKITTPIIYGNISRPDWIKTYNITEEYTTGIKVKINENEYLIPGIKTIGNRYVINKDGEISLCFTMQDIEKYIYELIGEKKEKQTGLVTIAVGEQKSNLEDINILKCKIDVENISTSIRKDTLTKTGVTLLLTSANEFVFSKCSGDDYKLYFYQNENWIECESISGNYTEAIIQRPKTKKLEEHIEWSEKYGELKVGKYKLERDIGINSTEGKLYIEFEIK